MLVLTIDACLTGTENKATVIDARMVSDKFLFRYEMNRSVIICEVVGHFLDRLLDESEISAFISYDEAFSRMLLACGEFGF